jgi:DNA-3-methyladenine glycosylase
VTYECLSRSFFNRPTLDVTVDLVGKVLVHRTRAGIAAGMIVETEAYIGEDDPACHAAPGPTKRNEPLYGPPGVAYVYLNYGMHYLVNAVTEAEGSPAAVLIRALQPVDGVPLMVKRRLRQGHGAQGRRIGKLPIKEADLCRGPGNLTKALGIALRENHLDLTSSRLWIEDRGLSAGPVRWGRRIGITSGAERPWRCWAAANECVSGKRIK